MVSLNTHSVFSDVCHTKVNYQKSNYLWIIDDYGRVHEKRGLTIRSLPFPANSDDDFKWHLSLHPGSISSAWISLYLNADNPNNIAQYSPITGNMTVSVINSENQAIKTERIEFSLTSSTTSYVGWSTFLTKQYLLDPANKLPQNQLTIVCEVSYIKKTDIFNMLGEPISTFPEKHESAWSEDIGSLFMDEEFADVTLFINGKNYKFHKNILAAHSSVFKAMLRNDMIEKKSNRIEIKDIDEPVFIEMLRYMYTGKPQKIETMVSELLEAADKYDLKKLKSICEREMYKNISKETVVDILILADKHNANDLRTKAIEYIKLNSYSNILSIEERKNLVTSYPHIFLEILDVFSKRKP